MTDSAEEITTETPTFKNERPRFKTVQLEYPVEFRGVTYSEIPVFRMTVGQIQAFVEDVARVGAAAIPPMFGDTPSEVIAFLDPDDSDTLAEAVESFLPRRMQEAMAQGSAPGAPTAPPSPASPDGSSTSS